jgi:hypothetical protein
MTQEEDGASGGTGKNLPPDQNSGDTATILASIEYQLKAIADRFKTSNAEQTKQNQVNRATFLAVAFYAVLTLGILTTNSCQWRETQRAANAATDQARIAEDTEKRQLRPYINISVGRLYNSATAGSTPEWRLPIEVENNGATQTKGALSEVWCVSDSFIGDDPMKSASGGPIKRFFGPKQTSGIGTCPYSPQILSEAQSNSSHLRVAAKIIYRDTLSDKAVPHITEFCAELVDIEGDFSKPEGGHISTLVCNFHNCADDECPKEDLQ